MPVGLVLALFVLEGLGVPTAPAVLGLFAVLYAVFSVATGVRRGWRIALRTVVLPAVAGLLAGAAVMSSGATITPRESMPEIIQTIMLAAPNTHFIILSQSILFRGAGIETVWPQFLALAAIGSVLFALALRRFRKFLG